MPDNNERIIHRSRDAFGDLIVADSSRFRTLYFGTQCKQSTCFLAHPELLVLRYTQAMASVLAFNPHPKRALLLGLGGASMAKFLLRACPDVIVDAVELREAVIKLAHGYFFLPENHSRLNIYCSDAEKFISQQDTPSYDLILVDAFDALGPIDNLSSQQTLETLKKLLGKDGILCLNWWNRITDQFPQRYKRINKLFERRTLKLVLERKNGNSLIFAFNSSAPIADTKALQQQANTLKRTLGVDAPYYLQMMKR